MRETKLYQAIVKLDGFELNRLHRFILSPYFNRNESTIRLFELIKSDLKSKNNIDFDKEEIWKTCFGKEEKYNDGRLRKLQSDLLKLIEEFYGQESYESNPINKAKHLLDYITQKKVTDLQSGALKSALKYLEEQKFKPASYYYYKYEIEQSIFKLTRFQIERSNKSNIEEIAHNLDRFYLAEKLRYFCTILDQQDLAAIDYKMLFIDEIIDHVGSTNYEDTPPIIIYYQILLTYKEPDVREHYDKLKEYIRKYIHLFQETEAKEIIDSAINYASLRMNKGEEIFITDSFQLYKEALHNKLLLVNDKIDQFQFKNIVTIGLRLAEYDWVETFINTYAPYLDEGHRSNALAFNLSQLNFYRKDYQKVIHLLSKVEYEDVTYNLNSKTLLMASYYELDEIEALNSLLDTFRIYVQRNKKLSKGKGTHYLNTINLVRKLTRIKFADAAQIEKLIQEVQSTQGVVSKNWILEKLAALKGPIIAEQ